MIFTHLFFRSCQFQVGLFPDDADRLTSGIEIVKERYGRVDECGPGESNRTFPFRLVDVMSKRQTATIFQISANCKELYRA